MMRPSPKQRRDRECLTCTIESTWELHSASAVCVVLYDPDNQSKADCQTFSTSLDITVSEPVGPDL